MSEVALIFHGPINHPATVRLRNAICNAMGGWFPAQNAVRCSKLFLLFSSGGGSIEDGFSLYNLLRSFKVPVVTVNMSLITSISNVVFLGGDERWAAEHSFFQFHDFDWTFPGPHSMDQHNFAYSSQQLETSKNLKKSIFKTHTKFTDTDFQTLKFLDQSLIIDSSAAKKYGIVQHVGLPALPPIVVNVDY